MNQDDQNIEFESQEDRLYRFKHLENNVTDEFIGRFEAIAENAKEQLEQKNIDLADELLQNAVEMVRKEVQDDYCRSEFAAFLIEYTNNEFVLKGIQYALELFGEAWEVLAKDGDLILLNAYVNRTCRIAAQRSLLYMETEEFCQDDT